MRPLIRAGLARGLYEVIQDLGGDAAGFFADAGIDPAIVDEPDRFVSPFPFFAIVTAAAQALNRPDIGLVWGDRTELSVLGPLYIAQRAAGSGRAAMELSSRFINTQTQALSIAVTPLGDGRHEVIAVRHVLRRAALIRQNVERNLVVLNRLLAEICGDHYRPAAVWFEHPAIAAPRIYKEYFGVTPLFRRERTALVVRSKIMDEVRPGRSHQLRTMAEQFLLALAPAQGRSYAREVRAIIETLFKHTDCSPSEVARTLGMHERTLQRRLRDEGVSFERLKDDVRREWAERLLAEPHRSLTQIAFKLHYANSAAFTRACQRWFAMTPSMKRRSLLAQAV